MGNKMLKKMETIQSEHMHDILLRELDSEKITISIGMGDRSAFDKSRLVIKELCRVLDQVGANNIVIRQKAYDNQDGWAPMMMVERSNDENIQMYTQVTPEKATEIVMEIIAADKEGKK